MSVLDCVCSSFSETGKKVAAKLHLIGNKKLTCHILSTAEAVIDGTEAVQHGTSP